MKTVAAAIALTLAFTGAAMANTCADAIEVYSNSTFSGDTCTAPNSLPTYGGTGSPQTEIVHFFTANNADAELTINLQGLPGGAVFLMPAPCSSSTDPTNFGFDGTPMVIPPATLTNGQDYYLIVTADPGGPADACGEFEVVVDGQLPVELQSFSVD